MNPQTGAWVGQDDEGTYLIRLYADGTLTAERKMFESGMYTGEVTLAPEPGWWDIIAPRLSVVS